MTHHTSVRLTPVKPGDVLLLRPRSLTCGSVANLAIQSVARFARPRFTHVAVVLSGGLIADAMPRKGVTFRQWADVRDAYSLERSIVARHPALAGNPDAVETLLAQATYDYKVRYRLHSLFGPRRLVSERFGLVCSQFVGLLLHEAEVAGKRRALETLWGDLHPMQAGTT